MGGDIRYIIVYPMHIEMKMKYKSNVEKYGKSKIEEILYSGVFEILNRDLAVRESRPCQHVS